MNEAAVQPELALPADSGAPADAVGFSIGWDHAHHGLVPPPGLLLEGTPVGQGWRAGRAVFGGPAHAGARPWPANRHTRAWLALRIEAWLAGTAFDLTTVTPNLLAQIDARSCPVRRVALGGGSGGGLAAAGAAGAADAPCIERLNPQAAWAAGNLVVLSRAAAQAWRGLSVSDLVFRARHAEAAEAAGNVACTGDDGRTPLDAAAWWRLATLRSFATPLPAADAARLPLAVLPPNRVRVLNAAQALQVLLTLRLTGSDWCARLAEVAALLPAHGQRIDFNLWLGAIAPRLLAAQSERRDAARALEEAWLGERVQRRWQHLVLTLGEAACEAIVRRLASQKLPGRRAEWLRGEQAVEGWALQAGAAVTPKRHGAGIAADPGAAPLSAAVPAPPAGRRRTARTPFAPPTRATAGPRRAAT